MRFYYKVFYVYNLSLLVKKNMLFCRKILQKI